MLCQILTIITPVHTAIFKTPNTFKLIVDIVKRFIARYKPILVHINS